MYLFYAELNLGDILGEGAFCDVKEITDIVLKRKSNEVVNESTWKEFLPQPKELLESSSSHHGIDQTDEADFPANLFHTTAEIRDYMSNYCTREDKDTLEDHSRYALKQLKPTDDEKKLEQGLIDISIEAKFLACLNHPNVIKMRGVAGVPLAPNFGIILDRLYDTLEDKMDAWAEEKKAATGGGGICGCLFGSSDVNRNERLLAAVTVAYDLAGALRYIHNQK